MFLTKDLEKLKTHILCSIKFFSENLAIYEIMWQNAVEPEKQQSMYVGACAFEYFAKVIYFRTLSCGLPLQCDHCWNFTS
jgi:hypothetical protein